MFRVVSNDHARNRARVYEVHETRALDGRPALYIGWGRLGHRGRARLETFDDERARDRRVRELAATRRRHGYR